METNSTTTTTKTDNKVAKVKKRTPIRGALMVVSLPVIKTVDVLNKVLPHKKTKRSRVLVGIVFIFTGGYMGSLHLVPFAYHWVWETVSAMIHGMGLTPICMELEPLLANEEEAAEVTTEKGETDKVQQEV